MPNVSYLSKRALPDKASDRRKFQSNRAYSDFSRAPRSGVVRRWNVKPNGKERRKPFRGEFSSKRDASFGDKGETKGNDVSCCSRSNNACVLVEIAILQSTYIYLPSSIYLFFFFFLSTLVLLRVSVLLSTMSHRCFSTHGLSCYRTAKRSLATSLPGKRVCKRLVVPLRRRTDDSLVSTTFDTLRTEGRFTLTPCHWNFYV